MKKFATNRKHALPAWARTIANGVRHFFRENELPPLTDKITVSRVLRIAWPLILGASGHALRLFADRVMLARYSPASIAAALPAGMMCFVGMSLFMGTAGYINTFVAQYTGAGRSDRAGLAVWQGLYIALFGGVVMMVVSWFAPMIFAWAGHSPEVQAEQVSYFSILARFAWSGIALATLNGFWSGRGHTRAVMAVELSCAALNVCLNAILIFGRLGFPELGIFGAGLATGLSNFAGLIVMLFLFLRPRCRINFGTWPKRTLDIGLLSRILRFGFPNGIQFMLDMLAFNMFIIFMGRLGDTALEAAGMAFGLNALAFLPIVGMGMAVSVLVGQSVGAGQIESAETSVNYAVTLALLYNILLGLCFWFGADTVLGVFARPGDVLQPETLAMAKRALRYITVFLAFDSVYIVHSHAIKGAGDTRFAMLAGIVLSWGTLVIPSWFAARFSGSVWVMWSILVVHIMLAGSIFFWRYKHGAWKKMCVIEKSTTRHAFVEHISPPVVGG